MKESQNGGATDRHNTISTSTPKRALVSNCGTRGHLSPSALLCSALLTQTFFLLFSSFLFFLLFSFLGENSDIALEI